MPAPLALLGSLATLGRGAMIARSVTPMVSRLSLNRFGMGRVFPFLKDTLKKGGELIKRGGKGVARKIPSALAFLGLNKFGANRGEEGGEFLQPEQNGGALSERGIGGSSEALGGALPSLRSANIPSLPSYKSGKEGETTAKLLSIAIKYLAGIDATLKNQLDVQRASFTQTNQVAREKSLEGADVESGKPTSSIVSTMKSESGKPTSSIVSTMKSAGGGILSFFSSMLMKTLLLTAPLIIKKISDMVDGFDFGFGGDEKETKPTNLVMPQNTATYNGRPLTRRGRKDDIPERLNGAMGSNFGETSFSQVSANIAAAEGTGNQSDPYNIVYGYGQFGSPNKPLTEMTLGEVQDFQKNVLIPNTRGKVKAGADKGTGAVGKYQFNYGTLKEQAEKLYGASWRSKKFTPEVQEKLAENLFNERKSSNKDLSSTWAYFRNLDPVGGQILRAQTGDSSVPAAKINEAAVDRAARESGVPTTPATPPSVVVAQNAPPPQSTTVTGAGPGSPSSPYNPSTMMDFTKYFSPMPA